MNLKEILIYIANKSSQTLTQDVGNGNTYHDLLKAMLNLRYKDFNNRYNWPWREKTDVLQTIANYETGTITVTNGSRTITGTNTVWTSAMEGRYLKLTRDAELYEVLTVVSATTITLRQTYIGDSGNGLSYLIWNRYYNLDSDVPFNSDLTLWQYPYKSKAIPKNDLHPSYRQPYLKGFPQAWAFGKLNRLNSRYSTGTVTVTANSKTVTGIGTAFLDNVQSGGKITIGSEVYNVESVDTDTQITAVQNVVTAVSGSGYTIDSGVRQTVVLSSTPDPIVNLNMTYYKRTYDLVNDNDETEIWDGFEHIPIIATYGEFLDKLTSERAFSWLTIYERLVKEAWRVITDIDTPEEATRYMNTHIAGYRAGLYS